MKKTSLKLTAMLVLPALLLVLASCSSTPKDQTAAGSDNPVAIPTVERGRVVLDAVTVTATVQSVDAADRTVTLQLPDGSTNTFECGPEVRNFDQIKAGDQVTATEASELAVALVKGGVPPVAGTATAVVRAPLGVKPSGRIVDTVAFMAKVVSVDAIKREVTLQMPDGQNKTVKVGPDINLANVNQGDDVGVRLTRAFAISVTAPNAAPATTPQ